MFPLLFIYLFIIEINADLKKKKKILIAIVLPNGKLLFFLGARRADQNG